MDKKQIGLLVLALVLVLVIGGAYVLYDRLAAQVEPNSIVVTEEAADPEPTPEAEDAQEPELVLAPNFTVYDADGNPVSLWDLHGKPIVLNFWASWCGPCKSEMPTFQTVWEEYGDDVHFLLVNLTDGYQETAESARAYLEENGYTFPVYYDTDIDAATVYGVNAIPTTYFLDEHGNAIAYASGPLDAERMQHGLDMILK